MKATTMSDQQFSITYDGPALIEGAIPVRELAPSLLSLAEVVTAASAVAYPKRPPVSLHIKATEKGSFTAWLIAHSTEIFDAELDVFDSPAMHLLEGFVFAVVGAKQSLMWLINLAEGRKIVEKTPSPDEPGHVTLTLEGDEGEPVAIIEGVPTMVAEFYENLAVRRHARDVVAPLRREGINEIRFEINGTNGASIEKEDLPAYELPPENEDVETDVIQPMVLDIVSLVFEEGNKWTFFDGNQRFSAPVEALDFLARVDAGESFSKGDTLHCDVRVIQRRKNGKLTYERRIVNVREHHHPSDNQLAISDGDEV
jgi:hypothetical protein